MIKTSKQLLKKTFNLFGLDIARIPKNPKRTVLGLKEFPIRSVIDVGANEGQFAKFISKVFPNANIYCFEPLPKPFNKLSTWAERRNGKVRVFNVALGNSEGTTEMLSHLEHSPSSSLLKTTEICEALYPITQKQIPVSVRMLALDNITADLSDSLVSDILVKIDVQGYEDHVIRGGAETLRNSRACILEVSMYELYKDQTSFKDVFLLLNDLGFNYVGNLDQVYDKKGQVISIDAVFLNQRNL